jgi:predicted acyltransferase
LVSLDAYRGFIMLMLVSEGFGFSSLKAYAGWNWLAHQVEHASWEGCTFWDLIQPAFTFMVGMSMPLSLARRRREGATNWDAFRHVAWRALLLIVLSNIFSNWAARPGQLRVQFINVLCQIAFGYVLCFLILQVRFRLQMLAGAAMIAGYWALFVLFPGSEGPWSKSDNIGAVIDLAVLGYNYSGYYTTINFIGNAVTILFGCWAGMLVQSAKPDAYKLRMLLACGAVSLALGLALEPFNPMVKRLWTASFLFFSTGWVLLMLAAFYWVVEMKRLKGWTFPLLVLGMNSIFVYSLGQIGIKGWLNRGLTGFTQNFDWLGPAGSIPQHMLVLFGLWYLCYWLYQRKIFIKI